MDCRIRLLLAASLICASQCLADRPTSEPCRGCAHRKTSADDVFSEERLRQARIELIKTQILQKLRLSEPPKPSKPILPSVITSAGVLPSHGEIVTSEDNVDDYYGTTENVVLFPDSTSDGGSERWEVPSVSLHFNLDQLRSLTPGRPTAHLWVHRKQQESPNVTYILYDVQPATSTIELQERILHVDHAAGHSLPSWRKYDITPSLGRWLRYGHARTFDIDCHGCTTDPIDRSSVNRPFIVISADLTNRLRRKKRSMECSSGTSHCCREELYLSFEEIGWNDWIIQPTGYKANFCRGSCEDDPTITRYHHTTVMQRYIQRQRASTANVTVSLCCSPSKLSSLMLLYIDKDENVYQKRLPNMVVEACDCA